MSSGVGNPAAIRSNHPLSVELGLVVIVLIGASLWQQFVSEVVSGLLTLPSSFGLVGTGLVMGGLLVAGVALLAGGYAIHRDIDIGLALPSRDDFPSVVLAALVPVILVAITKLAGVLTGTPYNSLTMSTYTADAPLAVFLTIVGLGILVFVPSILLVCHVVVQGSFRRVVGGGTAVVLTTLVAGFVLMSTSGGLTPFPEQGKLAGAVLFVLALGVALYATERVSRGWLRYLACLPAAVFVAVVALSGVVAIDSVAGGLFAITQVGVLGLAAYTYERTDSLLVPALAYLGLFASSEAVVFVFETGMRSW